MTSVPDRGLVEPKTDADATGRASDPQTTERPGVYVVVNIEDWPMEVAVSRGRALELQRAGAGRSLTWVPFDPHLGPGETTVTPPDGFTNPLDAIVNAPYEEAERLRREVDRLRLLVQDGYSALRRYADAVALDRREPDKALCAVLAMRSVATRMELERDGGDA